MAPHSIYHFADKETLKEEMKRRKHVFRCLRLQTHHAGFEEIMHSCERGLGVRDVGAIATGKLRIGRKVLLVKLLKHRDDIFINRPKRDIGHQFASNP